MPLERILVTLQGEVADTDLSRAALSIAPAYDAVVEGVFIEADPQSYMMWTAPGAPAAGILSSAVDSIVADNERFALAASEAFAETMQGASVEHVYKRITERPSEAARETRLARLMVACPKAASGEGPLADFVTSAMTDEAIPVCVPRRWEGAPKRIAIAWDGSREASRAIFAAEPLIRQAQTVAIVQAASGVDLEDRRAAGSDHLDAWLAARNLVIEHRDIRRGEDLGDSILASSADCDLLVAGAFGHSRLREFVFGGVTRSFLRATDGPSLLLAH